MNKWRGTSHIPLRKRLRQHMGDIVYAAKKIKKNQNNGFRVLAYHSITDTIIENEWEENTIPKGLFERHMKYLYENGYKVISGKQAVEDLRQNRSFAPRTVVITFDDGYRNNMTNALPVLSKYGFCATIFITANFMNGQSENSEYLNIEEIREIKESGMIDFGCHGLSHKALNTLDEGELDKDIVGSKKYIEDTIGGKLYLFAYPFGHSRSFNSASIKAIKKTGFLGAYTTIFGLNSTKTDPFYLRRNRVSWLDTLHELEKHLTGAYDWCASFECLRHKRYRF